MSTDADLLQRYVKEKDERAFTELVQRHLGLVYSTALRRSGGRAQLAEDVTQKVFTDLAHKAARLTGHPTLTGWFHTSTRYAVIDAIRLENRRQKLSETVATMPNESAASLDWDQLRPVIDSALDELSKRDREIVLLRFFDQLTFGEVGTRLNLRENAARMRTERALEKLRAQLARRGITSTAAALGLLLAEQPVIAAPAGLAASITAGALAAAPTAGAASVTGLILMGKATLPVFSAVAASGLTALVWMTTTHPQASAQEIAALRRENVRLTAAATAGADSAATVAVANEFAAQATAIARAWEARHAGRPIAATAVTDAAQEAAEIANAMDNHRYRGQATPRDAFLSFAWANSTGDVEAGAKLFMFKDGDREKALAVLASMPDAIRESYPTPEKLYAFFFAADALVSPPPGADVLENFEVVEIKPGLVGVRPPGATRNFQEYQQTAEGWKWVVPEAGVENAPKVLNNETLAKLATPKT